MHVSVYVRRKLTVATNGGQKGSGSGIAATIEPRVLDDLNAAVSLLKQLARTRLRREDQEHAIVAEQLRHCKVTENRGGIGVYARVTHGGFFS